jgi:hypothetical protein
MVSALFSDGQGLLPIQADRFCGPFTDIAVALQAGSRSKLDLDFWRSVSAASGLDLGGNAEDVDVVERVSRDRPSACPG